MFRTTVDLKKHWDWFWVLGVGVMVTNPRMWT